MTPCIALILAPVLANIHYEGKELFIPNMYLVRAKAVNVSYSDGHVHCVFEIEHVYLGANSLKGECFEARGEVPPFSGQTYSNWTSPAVTKGEVSIWWVADRPADGKMFPSGKQVEKKNHLVNAENNPKTMSKVLFPPARRGLDSAQDKWYYKKVEKYAQGIERVYRASGEERIALLKELCRRDEPVLQGWALNILERVLSEADYVAFLTQLAATAPLSLWMQHVVDSDLSKRSPAWRASEARIITSARKIVTN